jgi:hypothetical protein
LNSVEHIRAYVKLPEYFRTHTHEDLFDLRKSPFAYALGLEGMTYYEAISHDADRFNMFNMTMVQMESQLPVLGMYPFGSIKNAAEAEKERPLIVDVGGGRGQALLAIQKEFPAGFGAKMILQDRPDVIGSLTPEDIPNIETMVYDFFTPQPIRSITSSLLWQLDLTFISDAHIYLLRRILHDFYEPVCIKILKNVAAAMGPTSRLIVADLILPDKTEIGGDMTTYWLDFSMMMLNGKEKTKKEFEEILDAAGLEIVKVWMYHFGAQAQIECRLKTV